MSSRIAHDFQPRPSAARSQHGSDSGKRDGERQWGEAAGRRRQACEGRAAARCSEAERQARSERRRSRVETGRKDNDGQEAVVDLTALKKGMPKAIKLEKELADARSDASAFYKKFAKECGLNTAQLKKAAKAYADEDTEAQLRKAEQMSLIFTECGA
jgi:hypothetical protein